MGTPSWAARFTCPTDHRKVTLGIYRFLANGSLGYHASAAPEDRATLGSDPSAGAVPYGTGGILQVMGNTACFQPAGGSKAINPNARVAQRIVPVGAYA
jgi:hypothetical protein